MARTTLILAGSLVVASVVLLTWHDREPPSVAPPVPGAAPDPAIEVSQDIPGKAPAGVAVPANSEEGQITNADTVRVEAYLAREATRQKLQEYFDDPEVHAAEAGEIWRDIEQLEAEGRVVGFEAMHMKLAWLALNTPDEATYEQRATELIEDYAARGRAAQEAFKPEDIPGFTDYKVREAEIIAEVNAMDEFPQGQTRQQYLRERLLQARIEAYGEAGEQAPPR